MAEQTKWEYLLEYVQYRIDNNQGLESRDFSEFMAETLTITFLKNWPGNYKIIVENSKLKLKFNSSEEEMVWLLKYG